MNIMTTEEIEKAIERFTEERRHKSTGYPPKEWFKAGAEFADKHWQEKTRWKSLLDNPPKMPNNESEERQILIKHEKGGYDVKFLIKQSSIDYFLREGFIWWKEIEL